MNLRILALFSSIVIAVCTLQAQTPAPVVVQANVPAAAAAPAAQTAPAASGGAKALMDTLQQMKAANDETLRKQQATLLQLDEVQRAVEQIKVYTKRS